jgi:hypothetical protein
VNSASAGAFILGELIREDPVFDERFCHKLDARLWSYMEDVTAWALALLDPPPPHILGLMAAAADHQPLADQVASFYGHPHLAWDSWSTAERTAALLHRFGVGAVGAAT